MRRNTSTRYVGRLTEYNTLTGNTWGRVLVFAQVNRPGPSRARGQGTMVLKFDSRDRIEYRVKGHLAAVALLLTGSACDSFYGHKGEAVEMLKKQLFDPEAAQFRNVHEGVEREGGWIVCGEVNAKNRMGGYNGFRKFTMTEKAGDVIFADENTAEGVIASMLIEKVCHFSDADETSR